MAEKLRPSVDYRARAASPLRLVVAARVRHARARAGSAARVQSPRVPGRVERHAPFDVDARARARHVLFAVVHVLFGLSIRSQPEIGARHRRMISTFLIGVTVLLPGGFFLSGVVFYSGDPGLAVFAVPIGAMLLLIAVFYIASDIPSDSGSTDQPSARTGRRPLKQAAVTTELQYLDDMFRLNDTATKSPAPMWCVGDAGIRTDDFLPQGGGQSCDTGVIRGAAFSCGIDRVTYVEGRVLHEGRTSGGVPLVGEPVALAVDAERRREASAPGRGTFF